MTWAEAEAVLLALPRFADAGAAALKPGLERMETLLRAMGDPHTRFRSVHVAGTNGKGSTCSMLAAMATAAGLKTGLHTSPHLWDLAERMRIDGVPAPHDWMAGAVGRHRTDFERAQPSFFEATVALSLLYFAEQAVDLAVVEVGLGGRLDATNVLRPDLAIITHIGLDHADLLGPTVEDVAREKAGIAKPGVPLLSAADGPGVRAAIRSTAEARNAIYVHLDDEAEVGTVSSEAERLVFDLTTPVRGYPGLHVALAGAHQVRNAALAVRAAERVVGAVRDHAAPVYEGLANVRKLSGLAARSEVLQRTPLLLADVAHNADGLQAALGWARTLVGGTLYVLFGTMRDKDLRAMADLLRGANAVVLPVTLPASRAAPRAEVKAACEQAGLEVVDVSDLEAGVQWFTDHASPTDGLLATGSHLTASALHTLLI